LYENRVLKELLKTKREEVKVRWKIFVIQGSIILSFSNYITIITPKNMTGNLFVAHMKYIRNVYKV